MAKLSRGFIPKCPIFKPTAAHTTSGRADAGECLAERDGMRFLVVRYKNGNLVTWRVPNRGYSITKARREGRMIPISTPSGIKSIKHLLDEATYYIRRNDKPRA